MHTKPRFVEVFAQFGYHSGILPSHCGGLTGISKGSWSGRMRVRISTYAFFMRKIYFRRWQRKGVSSREDSEALRGITGQTGRDIWRCVGTECTPLNARQTETGRKTGCLDRTRTSRPIVKGRRKYRPSRSSFRSVPSRREKKDCPVRCPSRPVPSHPVPSSTDNVP